jgi:hypothetical protein
MTRASEGPRAVSLQSQGFQAERARRIAETEAKQTATRIEAAADSARVWPAMPYIRANALQIAHRAGADKARRYVRDYEPLVRHDLYLAAPDSDIRLFCEQRARECSNYITADAEEGRGLRLAAAALDRYGLEWPAPYSEPNGPPADLWPLKARLMCAKWWRRRVRALQRREVDQYMREREKVAKGRQAYCSDWLLNNVRRADQRNRATLEETTAENLDTGQQYNLAELAALGVANPKIRRMELMTRIRGFEEVAQGRGHTYAFLTLTCPSRFHAMTSKRGGPVFRNPKYDGSTPKEAQNWLCNLWAKIRAAWDEAGIKAYGFRVCEPHHDGCPHWHMTLFFHPEQVDQAIQIAREKAQGTEPEPGSQARRFDVKKADPNKAGAAAYMAKYVAKNIDGQGQSGGDDVDLLDEDQETGEPLTRTAARVVAWARGHGIRQFQQIGGPSVTVWRELRGMESRGSDQAELFGNTDLVEGSAAADQGDWAAFVEAMGGPLLPSDARPARPAYYLDCDPETGELLRPDDGRESSQYGDTLKGRLFGLWVFRNRDAWRSPVLTRIYRWVVKSAKPKADQFWQDLIRQASQSASPPGGALNLEELWHANVRHLEDIVAEASSIKNPSTED